MLPETVENVLLNFQLWTRRKVVSNILWSKYLLSLSPFVYYKISGATKNVCVCVWYFYEPEVS